MPDGNTNQTETVEMTEQAEVETTEGTTTPPDAATLEAQLAETRKALKKANSEAAARRKQLEQYEQAETARKQAEMSELEKLQARLSEVETRAKAAEAARDLLERQHQFYGAISAASLAFVNEQARKDALALVDLSETDGDDIPELIKELQKTRPYLFKSAEKPNIDGQARGKGSKENDQEALLKANAAKYGYDYVPPD